MRASTLLLKPNVMQNKLDVTVATIIRGYLSIPRIFD